MNIEELIRSLTPYVESHRDVPVQIAICTGKEVKACPLSRIQLLTHSVGNNKTTEILLIADMPEH